MNTQTLVIAALAAFGAWAYTRRSAGTVSAQPVGDGVEFDPARADIATSIDGWTNSLVRAEIEKARGTIDGALGDIFGEFKAG